MSADPVASKVPCGLSDGSCSPVPDSTSNSWDPISPHFHPAGLLQRTPRREKFDLGRGGQQVVRTLAKGARVDRSFVTSDGLHATVLLPRVPDPDLEAASSIPTESNGTAETVLSLLAVANIDPSRSKLQAQTSAVCPIRVWRHSLVLMSQTRTWRSSLPDTTRSCDTIRCRSCLVQMSHCVRLEATRDNITRVTAER
eukprot:757860-Hanusia_phi.AAC.2